MKDFLEWMYEQPPAQTNPMSPNPTVSQQTAPTKRRTRRQPSKKAINAATGPTKNFIQKEPELLQRIMRVRQLSYDQAVAAIDKLVREYGQYSNKTNLGMLDIQMKSWATSDFG